MSAPALSVIIPTYNRGDLIRYTLESVRRATRTWTVETIVVDDGSDTPVEPIIEQLGLRVSRVVRQENQGLLFARLAGLRHATGEFTMFLDSDDLVGPEKFDRQLSALRESRADISYSDVAKCELQGDYDSLVVSDVTTSRRVKSAAELYLQVQPPPHSPIFRTAYLRAIADQPLFPPSRLYNPVAEIWFYYNAAPLPGKTVYVAGPHTIIGKHAGTRLTNHWERLGVASLAVIEAFQRSCYSTTAEAVEARRLAAEATFRAWRALPSGFAPVFAERLLEVSKKLGRPRSTHLGGPGFQLAAALLGPERSARLFPGRARQSYSAVRTLSDEAFATLLAQLPPP